MIFIAKEYRILNSISTTKVVIKITTQYIIQNNSCQVDQQPVYMNHYSFGDKFILVSSHFHDVVYMDLLQISSFQNYFTPVQQCKAKGWDEL